MNTFNKRLLSAVISGALVFAPVTGYASTSPTPTSIKEQLESALEDLALANAEAMNSDEYEQSISTHEMMMLMQQILGELSDELRETKEKNIDEMNEQQKQDIANHLADIEEQIRKAEEAANSENIYGFILTAVVIVCAAAAAIAGISVGTPIYSAAFLSALIDLTGGLASSNGSTIALELEANPVLHSLIVTTAISVSVASMSDNVLAYMQQQTKNPSDEYTAKAALAVQLAEAQLAEPISTDDLASIPERVAAHLALDKAKIVLSYDATFVQQLAIFIAIAVDSGVDVNDLNLSDQAQGLVDQVGHAYLLKLIE